MEIGILTLKYYTNYGGILQLLSLYRYLTEQGHTVRVIDYSATEVPSKRKIVIQRLFNLLSSKSVLSRLFDKRNEGLITRRTDSKELLAVNDSFINKMLEFTAPVHEDTIASVCKSFDAVIIGSDQVWSVTVADKLAYFFDWSYEGKKIAYAACSVKESPYLLNRSRVKKLLQNFDAVSVRDNTTDIFVSKLIHRHPMVVCDPTMIVDFSREIGGPIVKGKYIFTYVLGGEIEGTNSCALEKIKSYTGTIPVVTAIIPSNSTIAEKDSDRCFENLTPFEWLNLLYYAEFVFTDSFHGALFSIHYGKNFLAYYSTGIRSSRLIDLSVRYGLEHNFVSKVELINNSVYPTHYDTCKLLVNQHIEESQKWLSEVLGDYHDSVL